MGKADLLVGGWYDKYCSYDNLNDDDDDDDG